MIYYGQELYHHGIKGQRWGIRRYQNEDGSLTSAGMKRYKFESDGSSRSVKKLNAFLNADKKYGNQRTLSQDKKVNRLREKYEKSLDKDITKAKKVGDAVSAKNMIAAKTYLKALTDQNFFNQLINDTGNRAAVSKGKKYTYSITRDNDFGGVKVTVNNHDEYYTVDPQYLN